MNEDIRQVSAEYNAGRSQLDHVLLATSGGAIYFAITSTTGHAIGLSHIPWGAATLLWGLSFYSGWRGLFAMSDFKFLHLQYLDSMEKAKLADEDSMKAEFLARMDAAWKGLLVEGPRAKRMFKLQARAFFGGASAFMIWHLSNMIMERLH